MTLPILSAVGGDGWRWGGKKELLHNNDYTVGAELWANRATQIKSKNGYTETTKETQRTQRNRSCFASLALLCALCAYSVRSVYLFLLLG